jgi:hypothetical protein
MLDDVLLAEIRRAYPFKEEVDSVRSAIFQAWKNRLDKVTIIVGKGNESSSASGQVVVAASDYRDWLEALQAWSAELEAPAAGTGNALSHTEHVSFANRYIRT